MKLILTIAVLPVLPTWAGQKPTPRAGDINFPAFYWEAAYRSSWGMRDLVHGSDRKLHTHGADVSFVLGPGWDGFNCNLRLGCDYGSRHRENGGRVDSNEGRFTSNGCSVSWPGRKKGPVYHNRGGMSRTQGGMPPGFHGNGEWFPGEIGKVCE